MDRMNFIDCSFKKFNPILKMNTKIIWTIPSVNNIKYGNINLLFIRYFSKISLKESINEQKLESKMETINLEKSMLSEVDKTLIFEVEETLW